jgi:hypothetical protein
MYQEVCKSDFWYFFVCGANRNKAKIETTFFSLTKFKIIREILRVLSTWFMVLNQIEPLRITKKN